MMCDLKALERENTQLKQLVSTLQDRVSILQQQPIPPLPSRGRKSTIESFVRQRAEICRSVNARVQGHHAKVAANAEESLQGFLERRFRDERLGRDLSQYSAVRPGRAPASFAVDSFDFGNDFAGGDVQCEAVSLCDIRIPDVVKKEKKTKGKVPAPEQSVADLITPRPQLSAPVPQPQPARVATDKGKTRPRLAGKDKENSDAGNLRKSSARKAPISKQTATMEPKKRCKNCVRLLWRGKSTKDCACHRKAVITSNKVQCGFPAARSGPGVAKVLSY